MSTIQVEKTFELYVNVFQIYTIYLNRIHIIHLVTFNIYIDKSIE